MTAPAIRDFRPGDEPAILGDIDASVAVDRFPGITRQDLVHGVARMAGNPAATIVALEGERIVGYCCPRMDDLTIHPDARRRGHGRRLVEAWRERLRARGEGELVLYGPSTDAARGFIDALGFRYRKSLWRFELPPEVPVPTPAFPADVAVRTYRDADLATFIDVANTSFADHVSPIRFEEASVVHAHGLPDFDRTGILLAFRAGDADGAAIGWTKAEHELVEGSDPPARRGLVAFVGVVPAFRGRGLGRELLRWAIHHGRAAGAGTIELNVEAENETALGLYRSTGFRPAIEWRQYAVATGA